MENLDAEEIRLNQRLEEIRLAKIELTKPLVISLVDVKYGAFPSIEIKLSKHDQIVVEAMRWIPGRNYINQRQINTFPIDSFDKVKQAIESTGNKLEISDELETKVNEYLNAVDFELDFIEKRSQIKVSRTIKQKRLDYIYDISSWTNHTDYYTFNVNELLKWMELQSKMTQYKFGMSDSVMKLYNEQIERERLTNEFAEMKDADIGGFAFRWTDKNGVEHSFDLKPDQRVACKFDDTFGNRTLLSFDMGKGKAQPIDCIIYTPTGPKKLGNIKLGDTVLTPSNNEADVIGIYPQGTIDVYKITFSDGTSTECCNDHLWNIQSPVQKKRLNGFTTKSLAEIKESKLTDAAGNSKWYIPITEPVDFTLTDSFSLPVDPYILGVILGDGSITAGTPKVSSMDIEILDKIREKYEIKFASGVDYRITGGRGTTNELTESLRKLGLWECNSHTKFIPWIYLYSSITNRQKLLQGLMDTDGSIYGNNTQVEYASVSKNLIEGVKFLIESLGGVARVTNRKVGYKINVNLPESINPFQLSRKSIKFESRIRKYNPTRAIKSIELIGQKECVCILLNSQDHLYLTNNFIVTHNTAIAIAQAERYNERVLFICKADLKTNIKREIRKFTGKEAIVFSGIEPDGLDLEYMLGSKKQQYNILSYSVIGRTVTSEDSDGNKHELMKWVELINFSKFDRIICDEAHYIKNMDSQRSKGVRATHSPKTMLLTGTPIVNRPGELFPALNIIDPITFHDYASFLNQFTDYNGRPKNLPVLHKLLKRYMIRRLRDASNDPNRIPQYTSLSPKAQQRYAEVFEGLYTALRKPDYTSNVTNILTEMLRLKQICADDKVDFTVDLAETALDETEELPWNKVLVFSQFKATQAEIANRLGSQCRIINGEVTDKSRYELVDAFQDPSNKLKVIVTNIVEGLTLTQAGTTIINDLWWTPKDHSQAEGRAFGRENDPHGGNSYYVLAENTIDDMIWGLLEKKMKIAKAIVDDVYVKYDDNESLFSELTKMIRG